MCTLDDLSDELILAVVRATRSPCAAASLASTRWRYNRLALDGALWRGFCLDRFGVPAFADHFLGRGKTWRWLYQARLRARLAAPTSVGTALATFRIYSGDWVNGRMHGMGLSFDTAYCPPPRAWLGFPVSIVLCAGSMDGALRLALPDTTMCMPASGKRVIMRGLASWRTTTMNDTRVNGNAGDATAKAHLPATTTWLIANGETVCAKHPRP
nr:Morn repeat domain containing protein [Pandoravirus aubagnensis]